MQQSQVAERAVVDMSDGPTKYVTGPQACRRYGVTDMTLWRWRRDPKVGFPGCVTIRRKNYWRLADLEAWEQQRAGSK